MIIRQLSVFLENKAGRLLTATDALAKSGIDIRALSIAETADFGILRIVVSDAYRGRDALAEAGIIARITHVIVVPMDDRPGGAMEIFRVLAEHGINNEYVYAYTGRVSGKALLFARTSDNALAERVLAEAGYTDPDPADFSLN